MSRQPFTGTGRTIESGALAVRKQDFVAHSDGNYLRHKADQIDMNPALSGVGLSDSTLQGTLEKISDFISQAGQGYIAIGDGYDTGDFTVGSDATPTLETAFEAAFQSPRLTNGGVILVKAGTYRMGRTVVVPPGITIMGEPSGTFIISATNQQPIFEVSASPAQFDLGDWIGIFDNKTLTGVQFNKFYNLIIADNLDGYMGTSPTIPNTITSGNLALIQCNIGSFVICERVSFLGKVDINLNPQVVSRRAIDYKGSSGNPTVLHVEDCYFDTFENCITFTPTSSTNYLVVKGCRMRFVGQHLVGADPERSSAISFNLCHANIENNYIFGDFFGKYAIHLRNNNFSDASLLEGFGASDRTIPRLVIMGNSGGLTGATLAERNGNFFKDSSSNSAYRTVMHGNTWGLHATNGWYTTIGDGKESVGDIIGPRAIEVALYMADTNGTRAETTFIVNPGDYTVKRSGTNSLHIKLIGNIRANGQRPVINLDCSSTDGFGRRYFYAGHEVRNIKFTTSGSVYHVVILGVTSSNTKRHYIVDNCEFEDCGLHSDNVSASTIGTQETTAYITNSRFNQSGDFDDDVSVILRGDWNNILFDGCTFTGHGYAVAIFHTSLFLGDSNSDTRLIKFSNTLFDSSGDGATEMISSSSPVSAAANSYIYILSTSAKVLFDNVHLDSVLSPQESLPIASSLRTSGTVTTYVSITALQTDIKNSTFLCPPQTYTSSGTIYGLYGVYIDSWHSVQLTNSEFRGAVPVYVGGPFDFYDINAQFVSGLEKSGAYCAINNCIFASYSNITGTKVNSTLLNLDLRPYSDASNNIDDPKPMVIVDGCQFENYNVPTSYYPALQIVNIGSNILECAAVMITAKGWPIKFINNTVHALQPDVDGSTIIATVGGTSAVFIDNLTNDSTTNNVLRHATSIINNNHIILNTEGTAGDSDYHFSTLSVRSVYSIISNNFINFKSDSSSESTPYRTFLWYEGSEQSVYNDSSVISGNIFARYNALSKAMIVFNSGRQGGSFTGNMFAETTVASGSSSPQFIDNTTNGWTKTNNRNQINTFNLLGFHGAFEIEGSVNTSTDPQDFQIFLSSEGGFGIFQRDTSDAHAFNWFIPLTSVLPIGSRVLSIDCFINLAPAWSIAGTVKMSVSSNDSTDKQIDFSMTGSDPSGSLTWSGGSIEENLIVTPENNPTIIFTTPTQLRTGSIAAAEFEIEIEYVL